MMILQIPAPDSRTELKDRRVKANVVVHGEDLRQITGQLEDLSGIPSTAAASGFSQTTCLPALSAATACSQCNLFGEAICTTSISGYDQLRKSRSVMAFGIFHFSATARARLSSHMVVTRAPMLQRLDMGRTDEAGADDTGTKDGTDLVIAKV